MKILVVAMLSLSLYMAAAARWGRYQVDRSYTGTQSGGSVAAGGAGGTGGAGGGDAGCGAAGIATVAQFIPQGGVPSDLHLDHSCFVIGSDGNNNFLYF